MLAKKLAHEFYVGIMNVLMEGVCMQIQAINNNVNFGKSRARRAYEAQQRQMQNDILALDDSDIKAISKSCAEIQTDDKKQKRIITALGLSVPVLEGVRHAVFSRGMSGKEMAESSIKTAEKFGDKATDLTTKFFKTVGKNLKGPAARLAIGVAGGATLAGLFAIVDGTVATKNAIAKKSDGVKNFEKKHPGTAFFATLGTALLAGHYIPKGISALTDKISKKNTVKIKDKVTKFGNGFNNNKVVKTVAENVDKMIAKAPTSLKNAGKYGLAVAPFALLVGTVAYALDHSAKKSKQTAENFNQIKDLQASIVNQRLVNSEKAKVAMAEKLNNR